MYCCHANHLFLGFSTQATTTPAMGVASAAIRLSSQPRLSILIVPVKHAVCKPLITHFPLIFPTQCDNDSV